MTAYINARLHLFCDGCWRRWPAPPDIEGRRHLCDLCREEPIA